MQTLPAGKDPRNAVELMKLEKTELVEMLVLALSVIEANSKNMMTLSERLDAAMQELSKKEDLCASQEAELMVLRNRPL